MPAGRPTFRAVLVLTISFPQSYGLLILLLEDRR
jgi:hypothetical protein